MRCSITKMRFGASSIAASNPARYPKVVAARRGMQRKAGPSLLSVANGLIDLCGCAAFNAPAHSRARRKNVGSGAIDGLCAGLAWRAFAAVFAAPPAFAASFTGDPAATCSGLAGSAWEAVRIDSAAMQAPSHLSLVGARADAGSRVSPSNPAFCKVLGHIEPSDPKAPPIRFQVNLPAEWNNRSLQYGGGGFNGVLITGLGLPPAYPYDKPSPLARGFVTYGTDSGHATKTGELPQLFALNDEAFENFAHVAYKKVRDAAVALMTRAYGKKPDKMYFMGSSEGGREGLTMAQRYPEDFDGIFARVPVINWVGLQHAGTRAGMATMGEGWMKPAQVKLVADAVLKACDKADGSEDLLIEDPVGCKASFKAETLHCIEGQKPDQCLNEAQIISDQHAALRLQILLRARQRPRRLSGLGHFGRGQSVVRADRRLDRVVARQVRAHAAARAEQRHRLGLWRRRHAICVRARSRSRRDQIQAGGSQGAAAAGLAADGLHRSRSRPLP